MPGQGLAPRAGRAPDGRRVRVGVIFGGRSGEHEVSLMSAMSVLANLDPDRFEVTPIGITKEGRWVVTGDPVRALTEGLDSGSPLRPVALLGDPAVERKLIEIPASTRTPAGPPGSAKAPVGPLAPVRAPGPTPAPGQVSACSSAAPLPVLDVVFPVLHGPLGEDGTIQGLLELAGIPYVGAGVLASAAGMDKAIMKDLFVRHGLPVLDYVVLGRKDWRARPEACLDRIRATLRFPVFVKPCNLGSSVGITKVHAPGELGAAIDEAALYDRKIIVENGLDPAREIECSVLGNDEPEASVCGEVLPSREFYDYSAKYLDGTSGLVIPAELPPESSERIRDLARDAFRIIDACGMARADFLVSPDGLDIYVSELNTIPGFTKISMYPKLWEASGLPYPDLLERLIELAFERFEDRARNLTAYQLRE